MNDDELRELLQWADDAQAQLRADLAASEPEHQAKLAKLADDGDRVVAAFRADLAARGF